MVSRKKILLTGAVIVPIVFIAAVRMSPYWTDVIIKSFSRVHYKDDSDSSDSIVGNLLLFLVFAIVTFYWNARALKSIKKLTITRLILHSLIDLVSIPVCILIMVIKHNSWKTMPGISSLYNPIALAMFPLTKHLVIALLALRKKQLSS